MEIVVLFILGAILASFINVCALRAHTGSSINTPSHCLSCGTSLRWYHLIPVCSYVCLWGRCASCGARIPYRYAFVELILGTVFVLVYLFGGAPSFAFLAGQLVLVSVLAFIFLYDWAHFIIPDEAVALLTGVAVAQLLVQAYMESNGGLLLIGLFSAILAGGFFYILHAISNGRWMGFGDVKLVMPLALLLTPLGVFSFITLSFWVGAIYGISVLTVRFVRRYIRTLRCAPARGTTAQGWGTIRTEVPFAPFLIIAFILVFMFNFDVLALTDTFISI